MRVPTGFAFAAKTTHRFVAWKNVFDRARQTVAGVGHSVGGRRAFKENKRGRIGATFK